MSSRVAYFSGVMLAAVFALFASSVKAQAETVADAGNETISLHGFGTLGMARSSTDQAEFVRDLSQPSGLTRQWSGKIDSSLGLQANFHATDKIETVIQVISRYHDDGDFDPDLTWAFVKFDPNANLSLRAGRLGTEFYMLADSRLVGYSYLPIRPPPDYYGALPFSYIDGVDGLATLPVGKGLLRGKLFTGLVRENAPLADRLWDMNSSRMSGAHLDYQQGGWLWRIGYAAVRFKKDLPLAELHNLLITNGASNASQALSVAGKLSRFYSAGMAYDSGPLQVQLMLSRTLQESAVFENSHAGYLIAGYRVGKLTPFAGYSRNKSTPKHLTTGIAVADPAIASVMADSHSDQHSVFFGLRWDIRNNIDLKAQFDAGRGTPKSIFPTRWERAGYSGRMNITSLAMDFVF